jgi:hypothetical protein
MPSSLTKSPNQKQDPECAPTAKKRDGVQSDDLRGAFSKPGSMGCGYGCHYHEVYELVPEADCPVHDSNPYGDHIDYSQ